MNTAVHVLILEDQPADAEFVVRALRQAGFEPRWRRVDSAADFAAALDSPPELILSDYGLPNWTGLDALKLVRSRGLDVPFILVSGSIGEETAVAAMRSGANDYLSKDNLARLGPVIERELRECRMRRERARQQAAVAELGQNALQAQDVEALLQQAVALVAQTLDVELCKVLELRRDVGALLLRAGIGWKEGCLGNVTVSIGPESQAGYTLQHNGPVIVEDLRTETRFLGPPLLLDHGVISGMSTIIRGDLEAYGILGAHSTRPRAFSTDDENFLKAVANILAGVFQRQKLEQQLCQAQKMEAVGQLAGGVAHDFNNLLTVISGYSDFILTALPENDPKRELIEQVQKAGKRAEGLTRQLLAFSRRQILAPQILNLNELVAEVEKMLHRLIGEDVQMATALAPEIASVKVDPGQIEQILMNLAVNARDAMPQGGKLTIATSNIVLYERCAAAHAEIPPGSYVLLAVSDSGHGIDKATQARIFEPFFTTKSPGKGTGLGLATVYGTVKQLGGFIYVYSEVGVGTTFKIYLPRIDETPDRLSSEKSSPGLTHGTETVLLAEDEDDVRQFVQQVLTLSGYRVLAAASGIEALKLCEEHPDQIALAITDVVMPCMSGRELGERLKTLRPQIKLLYMSGYTDDAVVRHGILGNTADFLQKPLTPRDLAARVRQVLDAPPGVTK